MLFIQKFIMSAFLLLFVFALKSAALLADESVVFFILEKGTGKYLKRSEVVIAKERFSSDELGVVKIPKSVLEKSLAPIQIRKSGFESQDVLAQNLDLNEEVKIYLSPTFNDQDDVVITGKKRKDVSKKTVSIVEAASVAAGGDPLKVAQLLPGVQTGGFGGGQLVIRGSGPEDSKYYLDQVNLPFVVHSIGDLSIAPDRILDEIEFSTGGFGAQFGNATGGAIVLKTKNEIPQDVMTEARMNVPWYLSLYHERPLDESSAFYGSVRRSLLEVIIPPILKSANKKSGNNLTVVPYFSDVNLQYLKKSEGSTYKVRFLNSTDGLKAAFPIDESQNDSGRGDLSIFTGFSNLSLMSEKRIDKTYSYTSTPNLLLLKQDLNFLGNRIYLDIKSFNVPFEFSRRRDAQEKDMFGFDYTLIHYDVDLFVSRPPRDDPFFDFEEAPKITQKAAGWNSESGLWASSEQSLGDVKLIPGVRYQYNAGIEKGAFDPRLSLRYELDDIHALKGALGQYSQSPAPDQYDDKFGNPDLKFKKSIHSIVGVDSNWNEYWTTDVQVFYKKFFDMIRADSELGYTNEGMGYARGLEIFVRRNLTSRLFGWTSYTYSQSRERKSESSPEAFTQYDQTHLLSFAGDYKLSAVSSVGGRFQYNTGVPFTPVDDAVYNANLDKYQPRYKERSLNSDRIPDKNRFSIYYSKDSLFNDWKLKWRFGIEEWVLGNSAQNVSYNYDYSKKQFVSSVPMIPYIEVRAVL